MVVHYTEIADLNAEDLKKLLMWRAKRLVDVTLGDLPTDNGCYVFFEADYALYAGKAGSMRLITRITRHLEPGWFARLHNNIVAGGVPEDIAWLRVRNARVVAIIGAPDAAENNLIGTLQPRYNRPPGRPRRQRRIGLRRLVSRGSDATWRRNLLSRVSYPTSRT
jgi:hypothetical protein